MEQYEPPTNYMCVNVISNNKVDVNECMRRFTILYNTIQREIDKYNIQSITSVIQEGKNIVVDMSPYDLTIAKCHKNEHFITHIIRLYDAKLEIKSSNDIAFSNHYMHQKVHKQLRFRENENEYIYPEQIHMTNVINYLRTNRINYTIYDPSMQLFDYDVQINCCTYQKPITPPPSSCPVHRKKVKNIY